MGLSVYVGNISATFMLSGIFIVATGPVETVGALTLATQRFSVAAIIFIPLMVFGIIRVQKLGLWGVPWVLIAAFLGVFSYNILFFTGLELSSAVHGGIIIGFTPILTMTMQKLLFRERLPLMNYLGATISLGGVLYFFSTQHGFSIDIQSHSTDVLMGDILLVGAAIVWASYTLSMKKLSTSIHPLTATAYSVMIGAVMLAGFEITMTRHVPFDADMLSFPVLYLAIFGTIGAFMLWFTSVDKIGPARTNIFLNFVPIFTTIMAWLFLDETISAEILISLFLVLSGVIIVQMNSLNINIFLAHERRPERTNAAGQ